MNFNKSVHRNSASVFNLLFCSYALPHLFLFPLLTQVLTKSAQSDFLINGLIAWRLFSCILLGVLAVIPICFTANLKASRSSRYLVIAMGLIAMYLLINRSHIGVLTLNFLRVYAASPGDCLFMIGYCGTVSVYLWCKQISN